MAIIDLYSVIIGYGRDRLPAQTILGIIMRFIRYASDKILILLVLVQLVFWYGIPIPSKEQALWKGVRHISPHLDIVPNVPGELAVKALSFGDAQFYFRILALQIQNSGDTFGRFTSLMKYDYAKLEQWFDLLDTLDARAQFVPALASYLFAQTPKDADTIHIVNYLDRHASRNLSTKWWWMTQAVYLANHRLKDNDLALKLAYKVAKVDAKVPIWIRQLPAFILEKKGEKEAALEIMKSLAQNIDDLSPGEINFMNYFIQERLGLLQEEIKRMDGSTTAHDGAPADPAQWR